MVGEIENFLDEVKQKPLDHFKFLTSQMCNTDYLDNLAETRYGDSLAMMNHSDSMNFRGK